MTVYVDNMKRPYRRMIMVHMIADSDEELHAMAALIGVQRKWWQPPDRGGSHYDICLAKKGLAMAAGAVSVTARQCAAMNARRRVEGILGDPETALEWFSGFRRRLKASLP